MIKIDPNIYRDRIQDGLNPTRKSIPRTTLKEGQTLENHSNKDGREKTVHF
jgi:hypothetical protein